MFRLRSLLLLAAAVWLSGCSADRTAGSGAGRPARGEIVAYVALDREFSEPILDAYAAGSGVEVRPKFDVESTKTVGLAQAVLAEESRPICDLFWNNEILNTLRLKDAGLLRPFTPERADAIPAQFKAADGTWYGFAGRARILIVNTDLVPEGERPDSIHDLADPKWKGRVGIAKPLFGTTATHAACLFQVWGEEKAEQYFRDLKANEVQVLSGNKQVALDVASGRLAFGLTDTDDAMVMIEKELAPVAIVYPDGKDGEIGTLFIPNTLALIKGSPNPEAAEALASYLLTNEIEAKLAAGESAQIPLLEGATATARVETPRTVRAMEVDFEAAAALWDRTAEFIAGEFGR